MASRRTRVLLAAAALGMTAIPPAAASGGAHPDFSRDQAANFAAFLVSEDLAAALGGDPGVVGLRVTASGLEVSVTGDPTPAQRAAVDAVGRAQGALLAANGVDPAVDRVPISFRVVPHSRASLDELTARLTADAEAWRARGVGFSSWGPDLDADVVGLRLRHYSPEAAATLEAAYGPLLRVSTTSGKAVGTSGRTADAAGRWFLLVGITVR